MAQRKNTYQAFFTGATSFLFFMNSKRNNLQTCISCCFMTFGGLNAFYFFHVKNEKQDLNVNGALLKVMRTVNSRYLAH